MSTVRVYTPHEQTVDQWIHIIGVLVSAGAAIFLLVTYIPAVPASWMLVLAIYGLLTFAMFTCSAAYHLAAGDAYKFILRRVDHAAIYLAIAATYTPFAAIKMDGWAGGLLLLLVWGSAAVGVAIWTFFPNNFQTPAHLLYLAQGWAALVVIEPFLQAVSVLTAILLGAGGLIYTVGFAFYSWESLRYHKAIWHLFVLAGAVCHFMAILNAFG